MGNAGNVIVRQRKSRWRRILKWALWPVGILLVLFALQLTVLAFPQLIISNRVQAGTVVIYYDGPADAGLSQLAAEVDRRLQATEFYDASRTDRVFFCRNANRYKLFTRLTLATPLAQGFNLSVFGNSFVSAPRVAELGRQSGGIPKYSIWEGNPAHTIAHEIGHQYLVDQIGRGKWRSLPHWKQEGIVEYIANIGAIRRDSLATLASRVDVLLDDDLWEGQRGWDRVHYEAGLLVEFLLEIESRTLENILTEDVTMSGTMTAMMGWRRTLE